MPDDSRILRPDRGQTVSASQLRYMMESGDGNVARFGPNVLGTRGPGGVTLWQAPSRTPISAIKPFGLMRYVDGGLKFKLRPGTVNLMLPSNIYTGVSYNGTGTEYIKLRVATSSYAITGITVITDGSAPSAIVPTANSAPTTFDILVHVLVNNVLLSTLYTTNIVARPLLTYFLERASPAAGAALYDLYYSWEVAAATVPA